MKINGRVISLSVDHDHTTGLVRDMLCFRCNKLVATLEDVGSLLEPARQYIKKHQAIAA